MRAGEKGAGEQVPKPVKATSLASDSANNARATQLFVTRHATRMSLLWRTPTCGRVMLCLAMSLAVAVTAEAQPSRSAPAEGGSGAMGILGIARNESVQKELRLSAEAGSKVKSVLNEFNTAFGDAFRSGLGNFADITQEERTAAMSKMAETQIAIADKFLPKLKELLTADQFTRLQQIRWQTMGIAAIAETEVRHAIEISNDQMEQIKSINTDYAAKRAALNTVGAGAGGATEVSAKIQELHNEREARLTEVLTKEQQEKLAALKGKEFDRSQLTAGFAIGGAGGGGGGRGAGGPGGLGAGGRGRRQSGGDDLGIVGIAGVEAVQKELGLSVDAIAKVKSVEEDFNTAIRDATTSWRAGYGVFRDMTQEEQTAAMSKLAATRKATDDQFLPKLKELLTAVQFTRLQQIHWQSIGIAALSDAEIAQAIPLSQEQQDKIKSINADYASKRAVLMTGSGPDRIEPLEFAKRRLQNEKQDIEREAMITELLTKAQLDKFASLKGKEFDLSQLHRGSPGVRGNVGRPKQPQPRVPEAG